MAIVTSPTNSSKEKINSKVNFLNAKYSKNNFGILQIQIPEAEIVFDKIHWVITVDRSGSMEDICIDKKSKIRHLTHTITNMIDYFLELKNSTGIEIIITLLSFNHEIKIIYENRRVDESLVCEMPSLISKLKPSGTTDIGLALQAANKIISKYYKKESNEQIVNIFMLTVIML